MPQTAHDPLLKAYERKQAIQKAWKEWIILIVTGVVLIIAGLLLTFLLNKLVLLVIVLIGAAFLAKATYFPPKKLDRKKLSVDVIPDLGDISDLFDIGH